MFAEQVDALLLPVASDRAVVDRDYPHPELRQRFMIGAEVQLHLVDFHSAARKYFNGSFDDACDTPVDREVAELRAECYAELSFRPFRAAQVVDAVVRKRQGVAGMRPCHDRCHKSRVADCACERPDMHQRVAPQEGVRAGH